ncbi:MAG: Mur ligase family protein [Desulfomonile sp.]
MKKVLETMSLKRPVLPNAPAHVHLMGIGGTGISALAGLFHSTGVRVSGSDQSIYPPVSDFLNDLGIHVMEGYYAGNLQPPPDLVVVGNVIRRTNPEAIAMVESGIPYASLPESLNQYFIKDNVCLVVTGTHGKTTVSSMLAWILHENGLDPSFVIGGIANNFESNYRLGKGSFFIVEGDEYDTAYFDKRPKFLHYSPHIGLVTSCEFDHADIYDSLHTIQQQFLSFTYLIHEGGCLVANRDDATVRQIITKSKVSVKTYGTAAGADLVLASFQDTTKGMKLTILKDGVAEHSGTLPVMGVHNSLNVLAAVAASEAVGIEFSRALSSLESFNGVARRQQIVGEKSGILIIDDFAHHPTAVRETCAAVRSRFPNRRVVAVFEPRSNTSRRSVFQKLYVPAFLSADLIVLREPVHRDGSDESDIFNSHMLASDLNLRGKNAYAFEDTEGVLHYLLNSLKTGDVVLLMSNGSFDGLSLRLLGSLGENT